jgi:hypothetical protein
MTKFALPPALLGLAQDMIEKGWQPVWCPARQSGSFTPLPGCTGKEPVFPTVLPQPTTAHKLAFRPPLNVLVIDVDHYDEKQGMDTIDRAEDWLGPLPLTYRVTSRGGSNPSGRYLYRIPADLVVTDSSLFQFADSDGATHVEIVRTGHRFSWAPGDYHYKNDELIKCFDSFGDEDELPYVSELPELPEKWVAYFRNPPVPQRHEAYTRPSDGAEWWLSQADASLGTDTELAGFAYNMLLSRVPYEEIWEQWARVARSDNPNWIWDRKDFERHLSARAESKADAVLARQDVEYDYALNTPGMTEEELRRIAAATTDAYENKQTLRAVVEPEIPFNSEMLSQIAAPAGIFFDPDDPDFYEEGAAPVKNTKQRVRSLPEYDRMLWQEIARSQAKADAAKILNGEFQGYEDISCLPDPPPPSLFVVIGKDNAATAIVGPQTVTVFSGHRASGKTWCAACWEAQVIRTGGHVFHVDFERQSHGLSQKLRALKIPQHLIARHVHYTSKLPDVTRLVKDITEHAVSGAPVLFVVDAFRGLQNTLAPGSSANDGDAVEQVYLEYLNPVREAGATIVLLDHMSKTGDAGTFGSERKESASDYVIKIEQTIPFTKTQTGFSSLTVTKDRYGVIAAGSPAGYLWMPGDGKQSGKSIEDYPEIPELRNWSPADIAAERQVELSQKGQREATLTELVAEQPLKLSINKLAADAMEAYPELYPSESSTKRYVRDMLKAGQLTKDAGNGKLDVPAEPDIQAAPVIDLTLPEDEE